MRAPSRLRKPNRNLNPHESPDPKALCLSNQPLMSNEPSTRKMAIVCNHADATGVMPTLIMASSALSLDYEVLVFFSPTGAPALVQGELEKLRGMKGLPDPVKLYNDIVQLGGRIIFCELALEAKDIRREDLREGVEIMKAPPFLMAAEGATMTFAF